MEQLRHRFPRIGLRIVKSALAVGLCSLVYYYVFGLKDIPFFFVIAAMQCMQPYHGGIRNLIRQNVYGTFIGAFWGFVIIALQYFILDPYGIDYIFYCALVALGIAATIYTSVVINCGDMANFACVVFICMLKAHISDEAPFSYVAQRIVETLVGIALGSGLNALHLPRRKTTDTLFVASLDEILHSETSHLSAYSKVELNRILDEGIPLSVITKHTVASFKEAGAGIRFKLPVILMDGAVIYDPVTGSYPYKCEISHDEALSLSKKLESMGLDVLKTVVADSSLLIFHDELRNEGSLSIYDQLHRSPYRNYIRHPLPLGMSVVYLHAVNTREKIQAVYAKLLEEGYGQRYRISVYDSSHAKGYSYIRIFSREGNRERAIEKLRQLTGFGAVKTFGNDRELYDIYVNGSEGESIIKRLRHEFLPLIWRCQRGNENERN